MVQAEANIPAHQVSKVQELAKVAELPCKIVAAGKEMNPAIAETEGWL